MKTQIKAVVVVLAVGAILQAVAAYANLEQQSSRGLFAQSQCDALREKIIALIERERQREQSQSENSLFENQSQARERELLNELAAMVEMRVEPGP